MQELSLGWTVVRCGERDGHDLTSGESLPMAFLQERFSEAVLLAESFDFCGNRRRAHGMLPRALGSMSGLQNRAKTLKIQLS